MGFAVVTTGRSEFSGYRLWGAVAGVGYLMALLRTLWGLRRPVWSDGVTRLVEFGLLFTLSAVVPLVVLVFRRAGGVLWSEQPEVWVVERSAKLLLAHGTP